MKTTAETIDRDSLCDIRDVHINPSLPKEQRIHEFLQQIGNPYRFRHGKYTVSVSFTETDVTLEDRLTAYIASKA